MTANALLEALQTFLTEKTAHLLLPTSVQPGDETNEGRAPEVHKMRLPDSAAAKKKAPYILLQYITGSQRQDNGERPQAEALVRILFCVYDRDESVGALALLNLMETVRMALLRERVIDHCFKINLQEGFDSLVYNDDTAPYFMGEAVLSFWMPVLDARLPDSRH